MLARQQGRPTNQNPGASRGAGGESPPEVAAVASKAPPEAYDILEASIALKRRGCPKRDSGRRGTQQESTERVAEGNPGPAGEASAATAATGRDLGVMGRTGNREALPGLYPMHRSGAIQ
ncbi:hypothetical protein MRX96_054560 [Rhipicephalus microplus]